jgi:hypothetical protein
MHTSQCIEVGTFPGSSLTAFYESGLMKKLPASVLESRKGFVVFMTHTPSLVFSQWAGSYKKEDCTTNVFASISMESLFCSKKIDSGAVWYTYRNGALSQVTKEFLFRQWLELDGNRARVLTEVAFEALQRDVRRYMSLR